MKTNRDKANVNGALLKQIKHDLSLGLIVPWFRYIPVLLIFTTLCAIFQERIASSLAIEMIHSKPTFSDYLVEIFKGMEIYDLSNRENSFRIPVAWLMINIYITYLVSYYPFKDLQGFGQHILLYSKNRSQWWLSKCIWNITTVLSFYLMGYVVIFIFAFFTGNVSLRTTLEINSLISNVNTSGFNKTDVLTISILLPLLTSVAISLFQMLISLLSKPVFGFIIVIVILVLSAYWCHPLLIGNYLMLLRNNVVVLEEGLTFFTGISMAVSLILFSFITGFKVIKNLDVLNSK